MLHTTHPIIVSYDMIMINATHDTPNYCIVDMIIHTINATHDTPNYCIVDMIVINATHDSPNVILRYILFFHIQCIYHTIHSLHF